jgi:poly-gamma-glutamate synthesis protein (capsule biosynthesis protein)
MIDNYIPRGLTGNLATYVARGAAGQVPGTFVLESGAAELDVANLSRRSFEETALSGDTTSGTIFPVPDNKWVSRFQGTGSLLQGRDLLWVGDFETEMAEKQATAPLLWEESESMKFGPEYAYQGLGGIRLERGSTNLDDAITTHQRRIPVTAGSTLSVTGMARLAPGAVVTVQVSWYDATVGSSAQRTTQLLELEDDGTWRPFRLDVQAPDGMIAAGLFIRLSPPAAGTATVDLDNLKLIEWAAPEAQFSPIYTHFLLNGAGTVTYQENKFPLQP